MMTGNTGAYHQNFTSDKKPNEIVEKDIRKWVESVVEFKAKLDKKKDEAPLEKHLKKNKKFKAKRKSSLVKMAVGGAKNMGSGQLKHSKAKNSEKKHLKHNSKKSHDKNTDSQVIDFFDAIKNSYRNLKLPPNWTSGLSSNRVVFNRIRVTTHNAQQKMVVERSLVITKDCNAHILINGSEISLSNWELQKINAVEDIKKAIKEIDSFKLCEGSQNGIKSPQCSVLIDSKLKFCDACKTDTVSPPPKPVKKKAKATKKPSGSKEVSVQKSFQK